MRSSIPSEKAQIDSLEDQLANKWSHVKPYGFDKLLSVPNVRCCQRWFKTILVITSPNMSLIIFRMENLHATVKPCNILKDNVISVGCGVISVSRSLQTSPVTTNINPDSSRFQCSLH